MKDLDYEKFFNHIDTVLLPWAKERKLHFSTVYRDDPVRSCLFWSRKSAWLQMYIDPLEPDESVSVTIWDHNTRKIQKIGTIGTLEGLLNHCYDEAMEWSEDGRL